MSRIMFIFTLVSLLIYSAAVIAASPLGAVLAYISAWYNWVCGIGIKARWENG